MKNKTSKVNNSRIAGLDWANFIKKTKNRSPRQLTKIALFWVKNKGRALDIGGGALNDTKYLLENGFNVDVIDMQDIVLDVSKEIKNKKLEVHIMPIKDFNFGFEKYDIIVANYVLPFIKPKEIKYLMNNIFNSLKIGGIFCGVFFGHNDFYKNNPNIVFHSKKQVSNLFKDYEKLYFSEVEKECLNYHGNLEHYHSFEIITKKKQPRFRKGSAALVVNSKNELLLVNLRSFEDKYFTVAGGGQNSGESLLETAYRELKEELNISKEDLEFVGECNKPIAFYFNEMTIKEGIEYSGSEKFYFGFRFIGDEKMIIPNPREVRSYKWVTYGELKNHLLFGSSHLSDTLERIDELFPFINTDSVV